MCDHCACSIQGVMHLPLHQMRQTLVVTLVPCPKRTRNHFVKKFTRIPPASESQFFPSCPILPEYSPSCSLFTYMQKVQDPITPGYPHINLYSDHQGLEYLFASNIPTPLLSQHRQRQLTAHLINITKSHRNFTQILQTHTINVIRRD